MEKNALLVKLEHIAVNTGGHGILDNISFQIGKKEQWAIVGSSGSGKTTLAHVFAGKVFYRGAVEWNFTTQENAAIELVEQQHHFKNLRNTASFYYQQRFNASEADDSITVAMALGEDDLQQEWIQLLHLDTLLQKPLLQLSNGENKRLQIARALLKKPAVLILDNPFIGLDVEGRKTLQLVFDQISVKGIHLILITAQGELPACITHIAVLEKGRLLFADSRERYIEQLATIERREILIDKNLLQQLHRPAENDFEWAIKMESVSIQYGDKTILDNINWQVRRGECWNLSGPNGAGKSTLLSLITGDNPQAYANTIFLFDQRRGSGESIWDIKRKIGFVSPELHLYFEQQVSCFELIASGLFDTIGLFRGLSADQEETVERWMQLMNLTPFRNKRISQLSTGQQRMALLARTLVKNPPLLILDEPALGLDDAQTTYFKTLINEICKIFQTTLVYVSHYHSDLPSCINHFLRIDKGKVQV